MWENAYLSGHLLREYNNRESRESRECKKQKKWNNHTIVLILSISIQYNIIQTAQT